MSTSNQISTPKHAYETRSKIIFRPKISEINPISVNSPTKEVNSSPNISNNLRDNSNASELILPQTTMTTNNVTLHQVTTSETTPILPKFVSPTNFIPGETNPHSFLRNFNRCASSNHWNNLNKISLFANYLEGNAYWFSNYKANSNNVDKTWEDISTDFLNYFEGSSSSLDATDRLKSRKQLPNELVMKYFDFIEIANDIIPQLSCDDLVKLFSLKSDFILRYPTRKGWTHDSFREAISSLAFIQETKVKNALQCHSDSLLEHAVRQVNRGVNFVPPNTFKKFQNNRDFFSWCCGVATERKIDDLVIGHEKMQEFMQRVNLGLKDSFEQISNNSKVFEEYHNQELRYTIVNLMTINCVIYPGLIALYGPQCAYKMYLGATVEELSHHCSFRCHSSKSMLVSEVSSDIFIITHPKNKTIIICPNETFELDNQSYYQPGALQVKLPCQCSLLVNQKEVISTRFPCSSNGVDNPKLLHVLLATWSKLKTYVIKSAHHEIIFNNMSECLDSNWTTTVPYLNLSTTLIIGRLKESLEFTISKTRTSLYTFQSDTTYYVWNIALSIICIYLLCKVKGRGLATLVIIDPVLADEINHELVKILTYVSSISLLIFVLVLATILICCCITKWLSSRQRKSQQKTARKRWLSAKAETRNNQQEVEEVAIELEDSSPRRRNVPQVSDNVIVVDNLKGQRSDEQVTECSSRVIRNQEE
ncbi:hypothetical protein RN001_003653 [Aquatica leii]|uniref:Retrotransposon gag domain-containing protein n=1 Tax=Aquatica leii TaxID=1421715 RepID=A0AAN7PIN8_9COLE|nr:hypothetical protein RN001_003653 [Aquatica leii]